VPASESIAVETFGGRIHVEWNPQAAVTPLPFLIDDLQLSGLYGRGCRNAPYGVRSPNAPRKEYVLGTVMLSVLSGHQVMRTSVP